jgi:hypothetical protein
MAVMLSCAGQGVNWREVTSRRVLRLFASVDYGELHVNTCYPPGMEIEPVEKQNITLAIPKELLQKAKRIAVSRRKSISGLLTEMIADLVSSEEEYAQARERQLALLESGFDLGTRGHAGWTRDELHGR